MKLDVFRKGIRVGTLDQKGRKLIFRAAPENENPPFPDGADVSCFFRNMLPEGSRERTFEFLLKASLDDLSRYFYMFGEDLPGDLSLGQSPEDAHALDNIMESAIGGEGDIDYLNRKTSLSGGEPKTALVVKDIGGRKHFYYPSATNPSTHILKSSKFLTAVEAFSMAFARECGFFPVAGSEFLAIGGQPVLLVERYDRKDGKKLAQEDFCQILGQPPADKYKVENREMAKAMRERIGEDDRLLYLRMSLFNMVVGNSDDHAKNFSLLQGEDGVWRLAPAYDIVSAATVKALAREGGRFRNGRLGIALPKIFRNLDLNQARTFGRNRDPYKINGRDIFETAVDFDVPVGLVVASMEEIPGKILSSIGDFDPCIPDLEDRHAAYAKCALDMFRKKVGRRAKTLSTVFQMAIPKIRDAADKYAMRENMKTAAGHTP